MNTGVILFLSNGLSLMLNGVFGKCSLKFAHGI